MAKRKDAKTTVDADLVGQLVREQSIWVGSLADPVPIDTGAEGIGRVAVLLLAMVAGVERAFIAGRACTVTEATNRCIGRPVAHSDDKIEYAHLPRRESESLTEITKKIGIPKISLHRYFGPVEAVSMATAPALGDIPAAEESTGDARRADK